MSEHKILERGANQDKENPAVLTQGRIMGLRIFQFLCKGERDRKDMTNLRWRQYFSPL